VHALLRQIHNRGNHTINQELLKSGLRTETFVILAESWHTFCEPYADTHGRLPADPDPPPQTYDPR